MAGWEVADVKLWFSLDETVALPASVRKVLQKAGETPKAGPLPTARAQVHYAVNEVPTASCALAVGRRADAGGFPVASEVHLLADYLKQRLKASIWAQLTPRHASGTPQSAWTGRPFKIFEGYTAGLTYQRSGESCAVVVQLVHWLDDLRRASLVSSLTNPQSPHHLAFPAVARLIGLQNAGPGVATSAWTGQSLGRGLITVDTLLTDFWGGEREGRGLLAWLRANAFQEALANTDLARQLSADVDFRANRSNRAALAALARFETGRKRLWGVPLRLRLDDPARLGAVLAANIFSELAETGLGHLYGRTAWDLLLELGGRYGLAVVPRVETALVVPWVKGLREIHTAIGRHGQESFEGVLGLPRSLRAVAVYGQGRLLTGNPVLNPPAGAEAQNLVPFVGGWYQGDSEGTIEWVRAPTWMTGFPARSAAALGRTALGTASAFAPGSVVGGNSFLSPLAQGALAAAGAARPAKAERQAARAMMDAYAHFLYANLALEHRQAELSGPLRFDIGPGSSVRLEGAGEQAVGKEDRLGRDLYATVLATTVALDAERPAAGTRFHLGHVRTAHENERDATSIDRHPVWQDNWPGATLTDES
jgi:hypothetical protein